PIVARELPREEPHGVPGHSRARIVRDQGDPGFPPLPGGTRPAPQPGDRFRLPGLPPAPEIHRPPECGTPPALRGGGKGGADRESPGGPPGGGPGRPEEPPVEPAARGSEADGRDTP